MLPIRGAILMTSNTVENRELELLNGTVSRWLHIINNREKSDSLYMTEKVADSLKMRI